MGRLCFYGPLRQIFRLKLKHVCDKFKVWNKGTFGRIEGRKQNALDSIMKLDEKEAAGGLSEGERILRMTAKDEFGRVVEMEEIVWKQKSRVH